MPEILKNIKAEDRLKKIRIVSENDDVMGGQPDADGMKENDNNAIFDLACSVMHALAEVAKVDQKAIPKILDALGDSRTAGASQRIVNEVNKLAKAAQTAANQANDKANTANTAAATADKKAVAAQNSADSAYNLANSKQDKLNFNKNDWQSSAGDVLKSGFAGIGQKAVSIGSFNWSTPFGFNGFQYEGDGNAPGRPPAASSSFAINLVANENYALQIGSGISQNKLLFRHKHLGVWQDWKLLLNESDIANNDGQSKSLVSSQYLVSSKQSLNKKIKDVTSIRRISSTYTNTTKDVIEVYVKTGGGRTSDIYAYIDDQEILYNSFSGSQGSIAIYFNVYPGERYSVKTSGSEGHNTLIFWKERAI